MPYMRGIGLVAFGLSMFVALGGAAALGAGDGGMWSAIVLALLGFVVIFAPARERRVTAVEKPRRKRKILDPIGCNSDMPDDASAGEPNENLSA